jgi:hypothetical protein
MKVPHSVYESAEWRAEERADAQEPEPPTKLSPFARALIDALTGDDPEFEAQVVTQLRPLLQLEQPEPIEPAPHE